VGLATLTPDFGQSGEVNVSDHKYNVGHNKQNRPEIPIGRGSKTKKDC